MLQAETGQCLCGNCSTGPCFLREIRVVRGLLGRDPQGSVGIHRDPQGSAGALVVCSGSSRSDIAEVAAVTAGDDQEVRQKLAHLVARWGAEPLGRTCNCDDHVARISLASANSPVRYGPTAASRSASLLAGGASQVAALNGGLHAAAAATMRYTLLRLPIDATPEVGVSRDEDADGDALVSSGSQSRYGVHHGHWQSKRRGGIEWLTDENEADGGEERLALSSLCSTTL
jgi:hypothetical protein